MEIITQILMSLWIAGAITFIGLAIQETITQNNKKEK